ncbi:hypothetical protein ACF09C_04750 [Streptomyces sp. NPDC014870]|uniref:hypothetical protein n=1 Tax=Streptomyces sp. NPDC014870 TaxID=3364925 RepID=UPI00370314A4
MTYRRAAIPALAGGLLLTALLWWAGASTQALHLEGTTSTIGGRAAAELERWLAPWAYDPPEGYRLGAEVSGGIGDTASVDNSRYLSLYTTAMQIRFAAVFAFFLPGALLLLRRLPPVQGRTPATLLGVWAWGVVAGTLAVAVSAPWSIAANGRGSYRFLPHLASVIGSGRQVLVLTALVAAAVTVLVARIALKGAEPAPRRPVAARAARLSASVGTAVVALSLIVLSYQSVAAQIQMISPDGGPLAEPGDLLRQWLLLGGWVGPSGGSIGDWLLYRAGDVLLLVLVWWALRALPGLLTRATFPAMALGAVCATVVGLIASQLLGMVTNGTGMRWDLLQLSGTLGNGVPAALTVGSVAGLAAAAALRAAGHRDTESGAEA